MTVFLERICLGCHRQESIKYFGYDKVAAYNKKESANIDEAALVDINENYHAENTRKKLYYDLKQFGSFLKDHFPGLTLLEVDHDHVIAFKNYLDQHPDPQGRKERLYTKESVNRKFSSLSSFYLYLGRRGLLKSNPLQFVKRHHCDPKNRTGDLSDLEVKRLLQQVDVQTLLGKMHLAMLLVFLNTGMSHSELRFLKKKNFFFLESF
ncbi:MAG: site-specific integrase [Oligoflexia bacterium]|nr:site-specific integrase [Oligoflexia bacterium]